MLPVPPLMESRGKNFPFITRNHHVTFRFLNLPATKPSTATLSREMELTFIFLYEGYRQSCIVVVLNNIFADKRIIYRIPNLLFRASEIRSKAML